MALLFGPIIAAGFVSVLLGSELIACVLAFAWSAAGLFDLGLVASEVTAVVLLIPALWVTILAFRRTLRVERALAAGRDPVRNGML